MEYSEKKVKENIEISPGIFKLTIEGNFNTKPGQFYMLKAWKEGVILPRPISIYDVNYNKISFLYSVVGKGTEILSELKCNDKIEIMGPLGNGFDVNYIRGKVAIVTGGIGIAPMNYLIKKLTHCKIDLYAGFRSNEFVVNDIKEYVQSVNISTENGKKGYKGYVTDLLEPEEYDIVICCGPEIMMKKVVNMCKDKGVEVYASMENRMACGIGACLVCTCKTHNGNKRTCKDGPVFNGKDLVFDD
ncbi:dihydroorotate dehydrogenase electron transfer subunit [Clostridium botulinum]|uniref:Dihydroorotate dehydrogenase B (NAD(+)), electron transfer subunit n=1 Tax=Clostridium botulinum D str. 1873 TaxID=592027 RepID=A0A9P2G9C8_CLOBO|nr:MULTISPECIES: dihydroorotate dehydrogenase electron transfer subunit [Clostridium]EES92249.1 dihydroorotate dehydrogenase electron transfer subunit [Clostridium botulinum D str. 1873]MBO3441031.1 dihydroorotate dehydrogenase electron transfer subunit [Clostridium haemolyticum]NFV48357.1 dihydroorotate dehydrogenase electron transfer subunit [Clostridium botulinum]QPW55158.1 dihydroorotate dehydrogenase electron transfer subunit [Clostridium botulinum]